MNIGDQLKDNDPRMAPRILTISSMGVNTQNGVLFVTARDRMGRHFSILTRRIHADGKPRKSGFDLISRSAR